MREVDPSKVVMEMPVNPVEGVLGGFLDTTLLAALNKGLAVIAMKCWEPLIIFPLKEQKEIEGFFRSNAPELAYYRSW